MGNDELERLMDKVRALLAKAESTSFPEEAKLLSAKAFDLMEKYSIDQAMLREGRKVEANEMGREDFDIKAPHSYTRMGLASVVLRAMDCRSVITKDTAALRRLTSIGMKHDLAAARVLIDSLFTQQARELAKAIKSKPSYEHGRTFTHNFLLGYASEVGMRLTAQKDLTKKQYEEDHSTSTALALVDKGAAVTSAFNQAYPRTRTRQAHSAYASASGQQAGRAAAQRADLGNRNLGGGSKGLGR